MKSLHSIGEARREEEIMRSMIIAAGLIVIGAGIYAQPAAAKKSKMGCEIGREHWDATEAKCMGSSRQIRPLL